MKVHKHIFRIFFSVIAFLLLFWSLVPLVGSHIFNEGVLSASVLSLFVIIVCIFWDKFVPWVRKVWKRKGGRALLIAVSAVITALLALFIVISGMMLFAAAKKPADQATVVVLGAAIRGDAPSAMLADRLDAAARYLEANERSACIVSGGQGADEQTAEADVMYAYLVNKGIDPARIYKEDRSKNTEENIRFSKEILEEHHLDERIVIATQEFHQFRAQSIAKKDGLTEVSPLTCHTKFYLLECYWVREFAGICRLWMLGY